MSAHPQSIAVLSSTLPAHPRMRSNKVLSKKDVVTWQSMTKRQILLFTLAFSLTIFGGRAPAQSGSLAPTPPMGWNSWNHYGCNVSDALIRQQADAMAASGLKAAGYQYINIDDCWEGQRDACQGKMKMSPSPAK
jgi:Alpha galactosidase A